MKVTLQEIRKSFGAVEVVKGLDLDIADGELLVLLGPSGCGKTTALRMVAGLESVTSGRILIGPRDVTNVLPKYRDVAMVFQSYALYPHMTIAENIGYPLKLRGVPRAEISGQIRTAAEKVHLDDYLDRYPRQLSGGQRQRVALARAIVRRPAVFLMDEPLSNLDAKLRTFMRAELKRLQGDLGTTTIYVTHDQIEAMTLAHRVAVMNKGVVQQIATPREIYDNPANLFVAGFIGSPPMNVLPCAVAEGAIVLPEGRIDVAGFAPRADAVFGFRPEDARIVDPVAADLAGTIYASELTGNETVVTCQVGKEQVVVKTDKSFELPPDTPVGLAIDRSKLRLFDAGTGERIPAA
ncbi:ABC transporter ATP-binding protein [Amaricoccus sp.]|uniref:ABC transporter ATP-binding protein n=1 Tax=Amaricoccus sp. TaxID=1872485 RepID=UPI0026118D68|nr:ABC transporter ATP-binding protein [Amaricoccus sp.]HRO10864.1 ABC transporter ATP-binding protein [Amaricoccus sp.]